MKKIKKPIFKKEYKILMNYITNNSMRENTKGNYLRLFTLLYYTGCRLNEISTLNIGDVQQGIKNKALIIQAHKQNKQREILLTPEAIKALNPLFADLNPDHKVIQPRGNPYNSVSVIGFIAETNKTIKKVLGLNYTSHSFRQGLITELGVSGINPKIIQTFIGHKSVQTTLNYINPSENDIRNSLIR